ncbi:MAG: MarR family winged helix-turn-helix transcriptional regulator [Acidimicrobiales bacterium]
MPTPGAAPALDRPGNVLGALALVVTDRMSDAVTGACGHSATAATALSALHHFLDRPSIDLLRQVLGLTSSGTVRLVDTLEAAGYVRRRPGPDARSTLVSLTSAGRRAAQRVSAARSRVLDDALGRLSPAERQTLDELTAKVVAGLIRGPGAVKWMCRLCDTGACGRERGECPVANAVVETFGP